jgi:hypothetical protein
MAYCLNCGKALEGSVKFCRSCGSAVPEEVAGAAAAPAPPPPPPVYPQGGAYPPGGAYPQQGGAYPPSGYPQSGGYPSGGSVPPKAGRSLTWLWAGLGALVVIAAVVCVLVFVVFKGGDGKETAAVSTTISTTISGGEIVQTTVSGAATTQTSIAEVSTTVQTVAPTSSTQTTVGKTLTPQQVVTQVFAAMEKQDVDALVALMDPSAFGDLPEGASMDAVKAAMKEELAAMGTMKFSGIKMVVQTTGDTTAIATLTAGVVTVTDTNGQTTSEDVKEASSPVTINLVKVDGKWYLESTPFL